MGLDIGSTSIKVGEIVEVKKTLRLKKFGMADLPAGAIEEGLVQEPSVVADVVRDLFKRHKIKEKNVAISIGGDSVIVKTINMQSMDEERLSETIAFEAEQYIPYDIGDVNLDYQILGHNEYNPDQMSVLLVAVKKEMVDEYIDLIDMAGLNLRVIDVDAFALQNIYEANYAGGEGENSHVALIDIGAVKTSLNILRGVNSQFMRDISLGCRAVNENIVLECECEPEEAEAIKRGKPSDLISAAEVDALIASVTGDWCNEIAGELNQYYSTYSDIKVGRILLSGGGGKLSVFAENLAEETGAAVEIINPFRGLDLTGFDLAEGRLTELSPQAAICLGLAIRRVDDK